MLLSRDVHHEYAPTEFIQTCKSVPYFIYLVIFFSPDLERSVLLLWCTCSSLYRCVPHLFGSSGRLMQLRSRKYKLLLKIHLNVFNWIVSCRPPLFTPFMFSPLLSCFGFTHVFLLFHLYSSFSPSFPSDYFSFSLGYYFSPPSLPRVPASIYHPFIFAYS